MDGDDDALGGHVSRKLPWPLNELSSSFLPSFLPLVSFSLGCLLPSVWLSILSILFLSPQSAYFAPSQSDCQKVLGQCAYELSRRVSHEKRQLLTHKTSRRGKLMRNLLAVRPPAR